MFCVCLRCGKRETMMRTIKAVRVQQEAKGRCGLEKQELFYGLSWTSAKSCWMQWILIETDVSREEKV